MPESDDFASELRGDMTAISGGYNTGRQWLMQLLQGLILAGIVALIGVTWSLQNSVTELRVMLSEREKQNGREIERIDDTLSRHDQRITDLERREGSGQRNAVDRQKRQ